jgi:hypothetical protein
LQELRLRIQDYARAILGLAEGSTVILCKNVDFREARDREKESLEAFKINDGDEIAVLDFARIEEPEKKMIAALKKILDVGCSLDSLRFALAETKHNYDEALNLLLVSLNLPIHMCLRLRWK